MLHRVLSVVIISCIAMYGLFSLSGCSSQTAAAPVADLAPLSNSVGNFEDIELPSEMKWNSKKSMAIKTDSFRGGILEYSGKVEINSLKDFIIQSMKNNQWKHVGEASYENILVAFTKPNKTCMITLEEGFGGSVGKTYIKMYITVDVAASQRLNPFGEPVNN